jgi:ArsR family transcriptional regulator
MDISIAVSSLAALAQVSRLEIFRLLVQSGPAGLCVTDIGEQLGIAPATLSFHLKELQRSGLISPRKVSRHIFYAPDFAVMNSLISFLTENCCGGASCNSGTTQMPKKRKSK